MPLELRDNVKLLATPRAADDLTNVRWVRDNPGAWRRGIPGTYMRGIHFDIPGVTLQQFLDANINDRYFLGNVTIDNGAVARSTAVTFRNLAMQNHTLTLRSQAQFAGTLSLNGIWGSVSTSGEWGTAMFATTLVAHMIWGTLTLTGSSPTIRFNGCDLTNCPDVRLNAGSNLLQLGRLQLVKTNAILEGSNFGRYNVTLTNLRLGSCLEISSSLGLESVNLGATPASPTERYGIILDYRKPGRPQETFTRREDIVQPAWGNITGTMASQTDLNTALNSKQVTLIGTAVTGQNIKTINNITLLGSGNIALQVPLVGTQVTGQNLKTVNGLTLLGTGNVAIDNSLPIAFVFAGAPVLGSVINIPLTMNLTIPANLANSKYAHSNNGLVQSIFTLTRQPGNTPIGTITVPANSSNYILAGAGSSILAAGDTLRMTVTAIGGSLTNAAITIQATRR